MSVSRLVIAGNLGADPESRTVGESTVCSFRIPLNTFRKGERTTAWLSVQAWNRLGESCQKYLSKGRFVVVDGRLQVREYEQDGQTKQVFEVLATDVQFGSINRPTKTEQDEEVPF